MGKIRINIILCVVLVLFNIHSLISSYLAVDEQNVSQTESNLFVLDSNPNYHFVMVVPNREDPFWQTVKKGAFKAAKDFHCGVEFNGPTFNDKTKVTTYLDIAISSRVDGIADCISDNTIDNKKVNEGVITPSATSTPVIANVTETPKKTAGTNSGSDIQVLLDKAYRKNIPMVTVDCETNGNGVYSYIGTNRYVVGYQWGKLLISSSRTSANIAVLLSGQSGDSENVDSNSRIQGLKDAIRPNPQMQIVDIESAIGSNQSGVIAAESLTRKILQKNSKVNTIICSDAKETVGVAQTLVDLNRVGEILVIGYDSSPEMTRYIQKGVVFGTVVSDPFQMGYESIKALMEIKSTGRTSSYISTTSKPVTMSNLTQYLDEISHSGE